MDRRSMLLATALVGFGLSTILIGPLAFTGFSILDDHHLIAWLGGEHYLRLENFWSALMSTEIGQFGSGGRFRPVLFIIMIFEAWLWGDNPTGYHVVQVIWFGIFLSAVAWASFRSIGFIAGSAV